MGIYTQSDYRLQTATRIPKKAKEELQRIAAEEHRSLADLIRVILLEWLEYREEKAFRAGQ